MPVNTEELIKDLETPEYQKVVTETLAKKEFIIRTKADETAFQDRFKKDVIEKEIPSRIAEVHNQYDKDIKELFGVDRAQDEKSYDYLKRVGAAQVQSAKALQNEIASLKEQIKGGDPTGALKKQLEEAEGKYKVALEEKDKTIADLQSKASTTEKRSMLMAEYSALRSSFKKDLPPMFEITEKAILDSALASTIVKDGVLMMANPDGTIKKDASFHEITLKAYLADTFKDVIGGQENKGGAGSKGGADPNLGAAGGDPKKITVDSFVLPEKVKTRDELMTYMIEIGIPRGTDTFNKIWDKHKAQFEKIS